MKLDKLLRYGLLTGILSLAYGSTCGAENNYGGATLDQIANGTAGAGQAQNSPATKDANVANVATPTVAPVGQGQNDSPQMQAATQRVDKAKVELDTARKRLNASKAMLKAAEAEFKAAKADKEALSLSTQAQQLADASGFPKNYEGTNGQPATTTDLGSSAVGNSIPGGTATGSYGGANLPANPVYNNAESPIDFSATGSNSTRQGNAPVPSSRSTR